MRTTPYLMSCLLVFSYTVNAQSQTPDDGRSLFTKGVEQAFSML